MLEMPIDCEIARMALPNSSSVNGLKLVAFGINLPLLPRYRLITFGWDYVSSLYSSSRAIASLPPIRSVVRLVLVTAPRVCGTLWKIVWRILAPHTSTSSMFTGGTGTQLLKSWIILYKLFGFANIWCRDYTGNRIRAGTRANIGIRYRIHLQSKHHSPRDSLVCASNTSASLKRGLVTISNGNGCLEVATMSVNRNKSLHVQNYEHDIASVDCDVQIRNDWLAFRIPWSL